MFFVPMQRFHHTQFADLSTLVKTKQETGNRISVCIPTLNEAETIGSIVSVIVSSLMENHKLVDEILVIDSGSEDATRENAKNAGATVLSASEILPNLPFYSGKGENLWKGLHASSGEIVCYVDGDISNFHPGFITGLVGPLLTNPNIDYVKAYYERPLAVGDDMQAGGGGRVSEILIRPMLSLFYPELSAILQPLSGEYAARRSVLNELAYPAGYGVEIGHLIDLASMGKLERIAQTDLVKRVHRNRSDEELGAMAFTLLRTIFKRLERDGKLSLSAALPDLYQSWLVDADHPQQISRILPEPERPPLVTLNPCPLLKKQ